jgi:hypothetical protein
MNFEEYCQNEKFNWKKGIAGAALLGTLAGAPSCGDIHRYNDAPTSTQFIKDNGLNEDIIKYIEDNHKDWERFYFSKENMTPNGEHKKYTFYEIFQKRLEDKFGKQSLISKGKIDLFNLLEIVPLNAYWGYYQNFIEPIPGAPF